MTPTRPTLLVVTGLQREAQIAAGDDVITLCSGGNSRTLTGLLTSLPPPTGGVLSFGLGGGLAPGLRSGELVIGSHVANFGEPLETDRNWHARIVSVVFSVVGGFFNPFNLVFPNKKILAFFIIYLFPLYLFSALESTMVLNCICC